MSCILSLVGGPAQRVQVLDWIFLVIKTIMPMTKVIMIFYGDLDDNDDDDNIKAK